jgi:hypothetical protein
VPRRSCPFVLCRLRLSVISKALLISSCLPASLVQMWETACAGIFRFLG